MLSPVEVRGQALKRYVRAAAALHELYDDTSIAEAVGVNRGAVSGWWLGAQMKPDTIRALAEATGLSPEDLTRFVYFDGPVPELPSPAILPVLEGDRRAAERRGRTDQDMPSRPPERQPRGSSAERE